MTYSLFVRHACTWSHSQEECLAGKIRLSIFLIAEACVGLPALAWALHALSHHYKSGARISALVITLLLSDLLVLLLNPSIVTKLLQYENCQDTNHICWIFTSLWSGSMVYGLYLQQAVVLEGALASRHPHCSAHAFFPCCSIIISITGFICFFLCELFDISFVLIFCSPLFLLTTLASCVVTCRAPPDISDIPYGTRKPSSKVLAFSTFIMVLHVTFIITVLLQWRHWNLLVVSASLMSLRVIVDPLLCVSLYRNNFNLQSSQASIISNTSSDVIDTSLRR